MILECLVVQSLDTISGNYTNPPIPRPSHIRRSDRYFYVNMSRIMKQYKKDNSGSKHK